MRIGKWCKIQSHTFVCSGVDIEDEVFVGHGVTFVNDKTPRATTGDGAQGAEDWELATVVVERSASIGSGALVLGECASARERWSERARSSPPTSHRGRSSPASPHVFTAGFPRSPWRREASTWSVRDRTS